MTGKIINTITMTDRFPIPKFKDYLISYLTQIRFSKLIFVLGVMTKTLDKVMNGTFS